MDQALGMLGIFLNKIHIKDTLKRLLVVQVRPMPAWRQAGILRPNFYAAPSFGRDDAPLKLNILAFYFRALAPLTGP